MNEKELETEYIPGNDADYIVFIQSLGDKAKLVSVEGHARWFVTREDGSKYIARPQKTNPNIEKSIGEKINDAVIRVIEHRNYDTDAFKKFNDMTFFDKGGRECDLRLLTDIENFYKSLENKP